MVGNCWEHDRVFDYCVHQVRTYQLVGLVDTQHSKLSDLFSTAVSHAEGLDYDLSRSRKSKPCAVRGNVVVTCYGRPYRLIALYIQLRTEIWWSSRQSDGDMVVSDRTMPIWECGSPTIQIFTKFSRSRRVNVCSRHERARYTIGVMPSDTSPR